MSLADAIAAPRRSPSQKPPSLEARRLGIDTLDEAESARIKTLLEGPKARPVLIVRAAGA